METQNEEKKLKKRSKIFKIELNDNDGLQAEGSHPLVLAEFQIGIRIFSSFPLFFGARHINTFLFFSN